MWIISSPKDGSNFTEKECMITWKKELQGSLEQRRGKEKLKKMSDYSFIFNQLIIFNQSILFNSRIKFNYKNKLNKKNTQKNPLK